MSRIDHAVTTGVFTLDGQSFDVENNVWVVGDDEHAFVIDCPHETEPVLAAVAGRHVPLIVCTHAHNDHVNAARELAAALGANVALHPDDRELWDQTYPDWAPSVQLREGDILEAGTVRLQVLHTPGHTPGGVSLYDGEGHVFGGDTLFKGGPGATGRAFSDFPTILESIRTKLLSLPPETIVYPGHGETTTIGDESPHLEEWIARGR